MCSKFNHQLINFGPQFINTSISSWSTFVVVVDQQFDQQLSNVGSPCWSASLSRVDQLSNITSKIKPSPLRAPNALNKTNTLRPLFYRFLETPFASAMKNGSNRNCKTHRQSVFVFCFFSHSVHNKGRNNNVFEKPCIKRSMYSTPHCRAGRKHSLLKILA